jgi:hypothetical protein
MVSRFGWILLIDAIVDDTLHIIVEGFCVERLI